MTDEKWRRMPASRSWKEGSQGTEEQEQTRMMMVMNGGQGEGAGMKGEDEGGREEHQAPQGVGGRAWRGNTISSTADQGRGKGNECPPDHHGVFTATLLPAPPSLPASEGAGDPMVMAGLDSGGRGEEMVMVMVMRHEP